ncbi:unnamed protein product [Symbiodinium sp. CCMP2592]|nr:unnamed protein product [Symbiodinium sp. CCMP2592]
MHTNQQAERMSVKSDEVADEEARQWRAFNLLFSVLDLREVATAECCHPSWNDFTRSVSKASLQGTMLKACACANYGAGPWKSGKRRVTIKQAAERLVSKASNDYMDELNEKVNFDRHRPGNFAKSKQWFGMLASFTKLDYDWSILEAVIMVANQTHPLDNEDFNEHEAEDPPQPERPEPNNRAEFKLLRESFEGTDEMIEEFLHDHEHHLRTRILIYGGSVLHQEYANWLEKQKGDAFDKLHFQAARSLGSWYETVLGFAQLLQAPHVLRGLDLRSYDNDNLPVSLDDPTVRVDCKICKSMWNFVVELSSARVWSQMHHSICFPHCFARVFAEKDSDLDASEIFLRSLSKCFRNVDLAYRQQGPGPMRQAVGSLIDDLGTFWWVLTRELIIQGEQQSWNLREQSLRELGFVMFASSVETKRMCEDAFAYLKDSVQRHSKTDSMGDATKMLYLTANQHASKGGSKTLVPAQSDIRMQSAEDVKEFESLKPFAGKFHDLPFENVTKAQIKKWRPAGYFAQRKAAAATAFILRYAQDGLDLQMLRSCWAGCVLVKGHVYLNQESGSYVLSLGFLSYATFVLSLTKVTTMGENFFFLNTRSEQRLPKAVFNISPGRDSPWRHVPYDIVPPACAPIERGICIKQRGVQVEGLLPSALLSGVFLTKDQIERCLAAENIPYPDKPARGNRILKRDLARALVDVVLGNEAEEVRERILNKLARDAKPPEDENEMMPDDSCPVEILQVLSQLDPENKAHFSNVLKCAAGILERRAQAENERHAAERERAAVRGAGVPGAAPSSAGGDGADQGPAPAAGSNEAPAAPAVGEPVLGPPQVRRPRDLRDPDSPGRRAFYGRVQAPPEFRELLPPVDTVRMYHQPRQRRFLIEYVRGLAHANRRHCSRILVHFYRQVFIYPGLEDYQRTKTSSWPAGGSVEQMLASLVTVFRWCEMAYHAKFQGHAAYDRDYKAKLVSMCAKLAACCDMSSP